MTQQTGAGESFDRGPSVFPLSPSTELHTIRIIINPNEASGELSATQQTEVATPTKEEQLDKYRVWAIEQIEGLNIEDGTTWTAEKQGRHTALRDSLRVLTGLDLLPKPDRSVTVGSETVVPAEDQAPARTLFGYRFPPS